MEAWDPKASGLPVSVLMGERFRLRGLFIRLRRECLTILRVVVSGWILNEDLEVSHEG